MSEENGWITVGTTERVEIDPAYPNGSAPAESPESASEVQVMKTGTAGPELMSSGSYAIYRTPSGGWHISYIPSDTEKMGHFEIPAVAVQMFQQLQSGEGLPNPIEMVRRMMAARNG
jgi:hypothetical protein